MREACGSRHAFGLEQMAALMFRNDFQTRANRETQ
jgi:hypothetical protein